MTAYDDHDLDDRAEGAPGVGTKAPLADGLVIAASVTSRHGAWLVSWDHGDAMETQTAVDLYDCAASIRVAKRLARRGIDEMGCWNSTGARWAYDDKSKSWFLLAREVVDEPEWTT